MNKLKPLLGIAAATLLLVGCGNGSDEDNNSGDVTITYGIWDKIQQNRVWKR